MKPLLITFLLLIFLSPSSFSKQYRVVDVVGDSLSYGINPEYGIYGWVDMLYGEGGGFFPDPKENSIEDLFPGITKHKSAVSGSTAGTWANPTVDYLDKVISNKPDLIFFLIGGNDFIVFTQDGSMSESEKDQVRGDIDYLLDVLLDMEPQPDIICMNYYDLFDGLSIGLPPDYSGYHGLSEEMIVGNQILYEEAMAHGCYFVDNYDSFFHHAYGGQLGDIDHLSPEYFATPLSNFDIHPITAGHDQIYRNVYAKLQELASIDVLGIDELVWSVYE